MSTGKNVLMSPPAEAYFRVEGDLLWLRLIAFSGGKRQLKTV
jgi:hypothetical protein